MTFYWISLPLIDRDTQLKSTFQDKVNTQDYPRYWIPAIIKKLKVCINYTIMLINYGCLLTKFAVWTKKAQIEQKF